jgi:hypothetical protein
MANRGYSGYYKGCFLKSSYEYVFAKILEHDNVDWVYEEKVYELSFKKYKPDFFIYNKNKCLSHIVEVKSEIAKEQDLARRSLLEIKEKYGVDGLLVTYKDLSKMCNIRDLKITHLMKEWIESEHTTIQKSFSGEINPHYSMRHSDATRLIIGKKSKARWLSNKQVLLDASKKGATKAKELFTGEERKPRVETSCVVCNKIFRRIPTNKKAFCSQVCSNSANGKTGAKVVESNAKSVREEIKKFILQWSKENVELIRITPYNKISNLHELFDLIEKDFNIKDMRIISKSIFGEDRGRKEFLRYLKEYVK